jgi:hypothetical protein
MTIDRQETVSIEHDGILITGQAQWIGKCLTVTITSPYQMMKSSVELKRFAPSSFEEPAMREPAAKRALLRCYMICKAVECHWHEMNVVMSELETKLVFGDGINALLEERQEVRGQRRDVTLNGKKQDAKQREWKALNTAANTVRSAFILAFLYERLPSTLLAVACSHYWFEKMWRHPAKFGLNISPKQEPKAVK